PGAGIGGGLGGLGGAGGNHLYNINREEAVWAEDQSLHTGLSRTDGRRAFLNDTRVAWSVGFATLGGMAMAAPVGALTDFTVGGALMGAGAATSRGGLRVILMGGLRASWAFARDPRPVLVYMTENSPQALRLFFGKETLKKVGAAGANVVTEFFKGGLKNSPGGGTGMLVRLGVAGGFMGVDALICGEGNGTFLCGENEVGSIDHFTGAVSGAIMVSEAFSFVLRIKPHGLMVANMFRIGTEWIMQIQQDVPIAQPDIDRMVIAAVDSATMVFFAKTYMRGGHFLRDFPLGRVVLKGRDLISSKVPHAGLVLTPITERGVQRYEAPKAIKLKTPSRVKRVLHGTLEAFRQTGRGIESKNEYGFTRAVTGNVIEIPGRIPGKRLSIKVEDAHLKVNKQRLNQWGIFVERTNNGDGTHTNRVVQDNTFSIDRNGDLHLPRYTQNAKGENLREEVVIPRGKALNHESELAHFGITANEVFSRNGTAYNELIFLEPQVRAKVRFTRTFFTRQGYQQLNEAGQERTRLTLGQRQITVSEEGRFRVQRYEGASYERRINPDGTTEVTLNPHYSPVDLDVVGIGGVEIPIWSGLNASKPRLRWGGAFMSGVLSGGTAKALNKYVFSPAMHGDGEYQSDQRALNYLLSEALTHPYVQWPLGYDTMGAQFWGRAVGIGVNTFANLVFPTYRDTWPGQQTYLTDLDNEELESAFENFTDNMTSLDLIPWVYNEVRNSWDYYEPQALEAFRAVHDQLLRKKDSERIEKVAKMFETMIAQEKEGDLTTTQRRGLRILAAYIAGQLNQDPTASDPALASFRRVKKESPPQVFGDIPPLTRDEDWEFFLDGINMATDKGRDFYLYLEPDHKEEPPRLPSPRK
ncbi:MAG: hypothetical protein Q7S00_00895, partial [bacterium]|nr:hypothetical protein [bacterium]